MNPFFQPPGYLHMMPTGIPVGCVIAFAGKVSPPVDAANQLPYTTVVESQGWMVCDGRKLLIADYGMLYAVLGEAYAVPPEEGSEEIVEFYVPDYRGYFLRMVSLDSGHAPDTEYDQRVMPNKEKGDGVGSYQEDAVVFHVHEYTQPGTAASIPTSGTGTAMVVPSISPQPTDDAIADSTLNPACPVNTAYETRPKNVYIYYLIRFL